MSTYKAQRGLSAIGWLVVLAVVGFFGLCAAKMLPVYAENYYIKNGLKAIAQQNAGALKSMRKQEIGRNLSSYFSINNVRAKEAKEIEYRPKSNGMYVINKYEVRVPLFANIDVVMRFFNVLDTNAPDLCCDPPQELLKSE